MAIEIKGRGRGCTIWRVLPDGRRVTVIDHESQKPVRVTETSVHAASWGANVLARRIIEQLERDQ